MKHIIRTAAIFALLCACSAVARAQSDVTRATPATGGRRLALVIGNNAYRAAPLRNAVPDAIAVTSALKGLGFDVTGTTDVSLSALERAVDEFAGKIQDGDVALFYYSGHGVQIDNENFLIPVDFAGTDEVDLKHLSYSADRVHEKLQKAAVRIIVLDACRDNPFKASRGGPRGLANMDARGSLIAFATGPGSTAADSGVTGKNGLFTEQFLELLKQPGLTANELFRRVRQRVFDASNGKQFPWLSDGLLGDFVFLPGKAGDAAPAPIPMPFPRPQKAAGPTPLPVPVVKPGGATAPRNSPTIAGPMGAVLVICDRNCALAIDGEAAGILTAGQGTRVPAVLGQHLVTVSADGAYWEQQVELTSPVQVLVRTDLNSEVAKIQEAERLQQEALRLQQEALRQEQERLAQLAEQEKQAKLRREQEARQAEIQRAADEARRQQELQAQQALQKVRAEAAAKFFATVTGTWLRKEEEQSSTSRMRTEDVMSIDVNCRGVLDRTVTQWTKGYSGWKKSGEDTNHYTFVCDGDGHLSGGFSGQIGVRDPNSMVIGDQMFTRKAQ